MKKLSKVLVLVLSTIMVLAMSASVFAAPGDLTTDTSISVTDLAVGDVVTYYQIVEWSDNEGWVFVEPFKTALTADEQKAVIGDKTTPGQITQAVADKIAGAATSGTTDPALTGTTWTKNNPDPGLYMVVVAAKESGVVYNPAFVAADYTEGGSNTISIKATYSDTAVAKKTDFETKKKVNLYEDSEEIQAAKASMIGEIVSFNTTTLVPVFLDSYKNPSFTLVDTVSTGMELVVDEDHPITLTYGSATATCTGASGGDDNVTITKDNTTTYTADFASEYLDANIVPVPVTVTYYAKITSDATFNVNRMNNTVKVTYSNGPGTEKGVEKDVTNHYTFSIGASIIGKQGKKGYEAVKVGVDKDGNELQELTEVTLDNGDDTTTARSLAGATFGLYKTEAAAQAGGTSGDDFIGSFVTLDDGIISFKGLDADTYYLKELSAPAGFVADTAVHPVVITATYEEKNITETVDGMEVKYQTSVLKDYTVTIDGKSTKYEFDNEGPTLVDPVIKDITTEEARIKNTKGVELPATGGIGTTIFYILGSLLVVGCGVVLISKKRMENNK